MSNMINMPMCYTYTNFLNITNKNKLEKFKYKIYLVTIYNKIKINIRQDKFLL